MKETGNQEPAVSTQKKAPPWRRKELIGKYRVYARPTRNEIIVRVEKDGDPSKYAEWGMPKALCLYAAMHQAAIQTTDDDIKE